MIGSASCAVVERALRILLLRRVWSQIHPPFHEAGNNPGRFVPLRSHIQEWSGDPAPMVCEQGKLPNRRGWKIFGSESLTLFSGRGFFRNGLCPSFSDEQFGVQVRQIKNLADADGREIDAVQR